MCVSAGQRLGRTAADDHEPRRTHDNGGQIGGHRGRHGQLLDERTARPVSRRCRIRLLSELPQSSAVGDAAATDPTAASGHCPGSSAARALAAWATPGPMASVAIPLDRQWPVDPTSHSGGAHDTRPHAAQGTRIRLLLTPKAAPHSMTATTDGTNQPEPRAAPPTGSRTERLTHAAWAPPQVSHGGRAASTVT